jgi:hypothetical protein
MPDPIRFLQAAAVAVLTAAAVVLFFGLGKNRRPAVAAGGAVLGVGVGFFAGCWLLGVRLRWPPREDQDRLLVILLPSAVIVELVAIALGKGAWLLRGIVAAGAASVLLFGSVYLAELAGPGSREWTPGQAAIILLALAVAMIAVWAALARLARGAGGRAVPVTLALTCGGAGLTVMLSGYASGGQLGLPLAAAVAGVVIASLVLSKPLDATGATGVAVVGLFALLVMGRFFGMLTTMHAILLFIAPLACWLGELPLIRGLGPRLRGLGRVVLVAAPVVLVVMLAQQKPGPVTGATTTAPEASRDDYMNFGK